MPEQNSKNMAVHSLYAHPQPAGLCALREYLLTDLEEGQAAAPLGQGGRLRNRLHDL